MSDYIIRKGKLEDLPAIHKLIVELAVFEKQPDAVINTVAQMEKDGFGENPLFGFIVAQLNGEIVGMSLYYYRYSTWNGKCLYLEDLIVTESQRGKGIGKALFEETMNIGRETKCRIMTLQVLDWNKTAIEFYRSYAMDIDPEWYNATIRLDGKP